MLGVQQDFNSLYNQYSAPSSTSSFTPMPTFDQGSSQAPDINALFKEFLSSMGGTSGTSGAGSVNMIRTPFDPNAGLNTIGMPNTLGTGGIDLNGLLSSSLFQNAGSAAKSRSESGSGSVGGVGGGNYSWLPTRGSDWFSKMMGGKQ